MNQELISRGATQVEYYAFIHQIFWEYFYACGLVWQFDQEQTISLDELIEEVFVSIGKMKNGIKYFSLLFD